jgi:phosphate transport system protein
MTEKRTGSSPRAALDQELAHLKDEILRMGDQVDSALVRAVTALRERDEETAREIISGDAEINAKRFEVEEHCLSLIATQQPAAGDLRAIVAAMNMVNDLERMADHAVGISKAVIRMHDDPPLEIPVEFSRIYELVQTMLRDALLSYRDQDLKLARKVADSDDEIDIHYRRLFRDLLEVMAHSPESSGAAVRLQFASHNLERIADRSTNLVERVIFLASGEMEELNPEPDETGLN